MRQRYALPAVLVARHLRYYLGCDVARGGKAVRPVYHSARNDRSVLEHVAQIDQIAIVHVLGEVVHVVEMDNALVVRLHDVLRQENPRGYVLGDLACHVVALDAVYDGILVRVFLLDVLVVALYQRQNLLVRAVRLPHEASDVSVRNVLFGDLKRALSHYLRLDDILNLLHAERPVAGLADAFDITAYPPYLFGAQSVGQFDRLVGLGDGAYNFFDIKRGFRAASL